MFPFAPIAKEKKYIYTLF